MKYPIRALPFLRKQCFLPALTFGLRKQCFFPALTFGLRKQCFLLLFAFLSIGATAQKGREKIDQARREIADDLSVFNQKLVDTPLSKNIAELIAKADNPYKQYWVSCVRSNTHWRFIVSDDMKGQFQHIRCMQKLFRRMNVFMHG
jgi:hypothetical protein